MRCAGAGSPRLAPRASPLPSPPYCAALPNREVKALFPPRLASSAPPRQGRARASLAKLYNWRYKALGDLPAVQALPAFRAANAGFAFDYQFIDVPDYLGRGERGGGWAGKAAAKVVTEGPGGACAGVADRGRCDAGVADRRVCLGTEGLVKAW